MKRIISSLLFSGLLAVGAVSAQQQATAGVDSSSTFLDAKTEVYLKENIPFKSPIPFAHVREADVTQEWVVWRMLDLRQRQNLPLYFPNNPKRIGSRVNFSYLLLDAVERGEITAYDPMPMGNEFEASNIRTYEQIVSNPQLKFEDTEEQSVSIFTGADTTIIIAGKNVLDDENVVRILVKEKWYFDKRHSRLECRVIGLCPIFMFSRLAGGELRPYNVPVMWIYMDEARPLLARHTVYNGFNEAQSISYDDFFMQNRYSGMIIRQSNVYDNRHIMDYMKGLDVLYEAQRIHDEIFNWEQDVWEY